MTFKNIISTKNKKVIFLLQLDHFYISNIWQLFVIEKYQNVINYNFTFYSYKILLYVLVFEIDNFLTLVNFIKTSLETHLYKLDIP